MYLLRRLMLGHNIDLHPREHRGFTSVPDQLLADVIQIAAVLFKKGGVLKLKISEATL